MNIYLLIILLLLISGIIFLLKNNKFLKEFSLYIISIILIIFSGLRGNFTSDYKNYIFLFNFYKKFNLKEIFERKFGQEIGYVLLNWLIQKFTNKPISIILLTSIIVITLYIREIKKESANVWLSIFLFVTIGQYYISFNLIRQIMAAGIIFSGSYFLYERSFLRYCIIIVIASLIHKTSLIMILFYFILNYKFNLKKLCILLIFTILLKEKIHFFLAIIQKYLYSHYVAEAYGMTGISYKNFLLPFGILLFIFFNINLKNYRDDKNLNIWINAAIFYAFFSFLGLEIQMLERFSNYFAPYILLVIPKIIQDKKNKQVRAVLYFFIIIGSIAYNYLSLNNTGYDPYYFI